MKKLFAFFILFTASIGNAFSQNVQEERLMTDSTMNIIEVETIDIEQMSAPVAKDWYKTTKEWKNYKLFRTLGWTFFGVGIPLTVGCFIGAFIVAWESGSPWGTVVLFAGSLMGLTMTVSSIPIITLAYINRYKAKKSKIDFGVSNINTPYFTPRKNNLPALNFCLTF